MAAITMHETTEDIDTAKDAISDENHWRKPSNTIPLIINSSLNEENYSKI